MVNSGVPEFGACTTSTLTDEEVEVLPFYNNEGREMELALQYNW